MPDAHREDIAKLESLYAEHPEGRIFTHLAEAYRKAGELDRAADVLRQGLEKHPDYSSAHVVLGRVLVDQGRSEDAAAAFHRVLDLDSHNLVALRALGDIARADGREADAVGYYARLLDVEPADDQVRQLMDSLTAEEAAQTAPEAGGEPAPADDEPWTTAEEDVFEPWAEARSEDETAAEVEPEAGAEPWDAPAEEDADTDPWSTPAEQETATGQEKESDPWAASAEAPPETGAPGADEEDALVFEPWADADDGDDGAADDEPFEPWADFETQDEPSVSPESETHAVDEPEAGVGGVADAEDPSGWSPGNAYGLPEPSDEEAPTTAPGVMTETIAQVYARQGLYDRAAEVYRELVRERPDDPDLRGKLEEMESLASSQAAVPGLESDDFDPSDADAQPLPGLDADEFDSDTGLSQAALPPQSTPEPWDADSVYGEWLQPGAGGFEEQDGDDDAPGGDEEVASEPGFHGTEEEDSVWVGGDWSEAPEKTPYAWADSEQDDQEDRSPPIGSYFQSLLGWRPGEPDESAGQGFEVESADQDEGRERTAPQGSGEGTGAADEALSGGSTDLPEEAPEPSDEEDDDLDTFRSWLENLKQ